MEKLDEVRTLSSQELDGVAGAGFGWLKPAAKFAGKELIPGVSDFYSGYCAGKKFAEDRRKGVGWKKTAVDTALAYLF